MKKHIIYHIIIAACLSQLFVDHLAAQPVPNFTQPCNGSLGSIELIMPVGVPEGYYTFLWQDEADQTIGTEKDIYNLPTGTYSVLISDPNGCSGYFIYDLGLRAFFTLTPEDCLNDPNFDANSGWENAFGTDNNVVAQDASIGENIVAYDWYASIGGIEITSGFCDTSGDVDDCKQYFCDTEGIVSITLTVTDANGCTDSHTESITVIDYEEQDAGEFDVEFVPPHSLCNAEYSLCNDNNTGQIRLIPNENYIGGASCYNFILQKLENGFYELYSDTPTYNDDLGVSFTCLPAGTYQVKAPNTLTGYGPPLSPASSNQFMFIFEEPAPITNIVETYTLGSLQFTTGDLNGLDWCKGKASFTSIEGEDMTNTSHYRFAWLDCSPPESCNTPDRTDLCAGQYTGFAFNELTGCQYTQTFIVDFRNTYVTTNVVIKLEAATPALRLAGLIPTEQPYNKAPWNYNGSESVASTSDIPPTALDWILVEARHEADTTKTLARSAGFLLEDGNIVGTDGTTLRLINLLENEKYYVIIRHRNHLAISSRNGITLPNTVETKYDFTTSVTQAKGNGQMRLLPSGKFAMCAGDFNADGKIGGADYQGYLEESSSINGYLQSDFNLDKHRSTTDFNLMLNNSGAMGVDWIRYD